MVDKMGLRAEIKSKFGRWAREHESQLADLKFSFHLLSKSSLAIIGFSIVFLTLIVTIFGAYLTPYDPFDYNLAENFKPPSSVHWFGTDEMGRDIFSRTLYGARYSLFAGLTAVIIGLVIGTFIGLVSGYFAGKMDEFLMRIMDVLLAFPPLVLALAITASLGANLVNAAVSIGIVNIPRFARLVRSQALSIRRKLYVESAQISGSGSLRIILNISSQTPLLPA
jgi:peptide/nickel transport system permease protein